MRRFMLPTIAVVALTLTLSGCGWLFGPSVDQVKPGDLESYSASNTFVDDKTAVETASSDTGNSASEALGYVFSTEVNPELSVSSRVTSYEELFRVLVDESVAAARSAAASEVEGPSRTVTVTDNSDDSDPTDQVYDVRVDISNETVSASDASTHADAGGTATIETFFVDVDGSYVESSDGSERVEGSVDHDGTVSYEEWTTDGIVVIHQGRINTAGDGEIDVQVNADDSGRLQWSFRQELSAGFSVSNTSTGEGGKIIIEFSYRGNNDVTFAAGEDPTGTATGELEASMTVRVYDNNNDLVSEYTYTDEEVFSGSI